MADKKKTVAKWEEQFGLLFTNATTDLSEKLTIDEFTERISKPEEYPHVGIALKERTAWLKYNGYDVTRENLADSELPTIKLPKELLIDNAPE